jgi:hypothetical protein
VSELFGQPKLEKRREGAVKDPRPRWIGRASLVTSALSVALISFAVAGELTGERNPDTFTASAYSCSSPVARWSGMLFLVVVPLTALGAIILGLYAPGGLRWKAVAAGLVPLALFVGLLLVLNAMHPGEAQAWPIFGHVCREV